MPRIWPSLCRILLSTILGSSAALAEPAVVRPGEALDGEAIRRLVTEELPAPPDGSWSVRVLRPAAPMTNPTSGNMIITVEEIGGMPLDAGGIDGRLDGKLRVEDAWGHVAHLPFAADAHAMVDVPVPLRPIPAGVLLDDSMLGSLRIPLAKLDDNDVRSTSEVRGSEVARRLQAGRPFSHTSLRQPSAIRRGDPVLITFLRGALRLTVTGRALEDAALGQPVRATNAASNREVQGMVSGPGEVTLGETTR